MPLQWSRPQEGGVDAAVYQLGNDVLIEPCSPACLLRNLPQDARCVRTGQTPATHLSILLSDQLLLPINVSPRAENHVLGAQTNQLDPRQRWQRVIDRPHTNLMPCLAVCDCMARVSIVAGHPLWDANTVPPWQRQRLHRPDAILSLGAHIPFQKWAKWMADLSHGLAALHAIHLSHGDPFPFNAIIAHQAAVWVDFSHLSDDPAQQLKDVWAFLLFTAAFSLRFCDQVSPSLLQDVSQQLRAGSPTDLMLRLKEVFDRPRTDCLAISKFPLIQALERWVLDSGVLQSDNPLAPHCRNLLARATQHYYHEFLYWLAAGRDLASVLEAESTRHRLMENETLRLMVPRAELDAASERTRQVSEQLAALNAERQHLAAESQRVATELHRAAADLRQAESRLIEQQQQEAARLAAADAERQHLAADLQRAESRLLEQQQQQAARLADAAAERQHLADRLAADLHQAESRLLEQQQQQAARLAAADAERDHLLLKITDLANQMLPLRDAADVAERDAKSLCYRLTILQTESATAKHELELTTTSIDTHCRQAEQLTQQYEAARQVFAGIQQSADQLASLVEEYKMHKSFRAARLMQLLRNSILTGPIRHRLRFTGKLLRRLAGSKTPISNFNVMDAIVEKARQIAATATAAHNSPGTPTGLPTPTFAEPARSSNVPYFGIRPPHGRRRVAILTNQLLDWVDRRPRFGGGERYAITIASLLRDLALDVHFFQPANEPFEGEYHGFPVTTFVQTGDFFSEFCHGNCSRFTELAKDFDHILHNMPEYTSGVVREDAILVCHGIWFDHNNYPTAAFRTPIWYRHLERTFRNPCRVVSVDTNSINYVRSMWPELADRMRFIPNTYNARQFFPNESTRDPNRLTVLFPRRSQINRGSRILADILKRIPHDVRFCWVGEGDAQDTNIILEVAKRDPRLTFHVATFNEMPAWYQHADIAVIPTIACEGTSYSCIEALASGCATVSTHVGGLSDIIHTGLNGLLVDPNPAAIANAINRLIEDPEERRRLQQVGPTSIEPFELKHWRAQWAQILLEQDWTEEKKLRELNLLPTTNTAATSPSHIEITTPTDPLKGKRVAIVTRNAIHGGVETIIAAQCRQLNAPVIVAGGLDYPNTCPFPYTRADTYEELRKQLADFDVVLYHWLPPFAVQAVSDSAVPSVEFVHRTDTADNDKSVPTELVAHSSFLAEFIFRTFGRRCSIVEHPIDTDRFVPPPHLGPCIGGLTSYYQTKGLDIFLHACSDLGKQFPDIRPRFYGQGDAQDDLEKLSRKLGLHAEFRPPTPEPWKVLPEFRCFVVPSRIEGLPIAVLEALAMNIPVIASDLPGMIEFNRLATRRAFAPPIITFTQQDPSSLAQKIRELLADPTRPDTHPYIQQYYSIAQHCRNLALVLRQAIDRRPTRT
ncbi:MAG: glycosyltransferase [Planctomycetota bacterium]|nr:glycosyltransferase [Planctomycetota bacterium]